MSTREKNQNSILALSTSISEKESIGKPQFPTSNSTSAAEVINDASMIPKPKYKEECLSESVDTPSISIQNDVFSVNYDEDIFRDAESVKKIIADILGSDDLSQEHNKVSNNQNSQSILSINQSFERPGNEIGVEYNEIAFPNYEKTSVAGIPMNRINPSSKCSQNDQNMLENTRLWNTTQILPVPENKPNCILRNSALNSVKTNPPLNISYLHNQATCPETKEEKKVPGYNTKTIGNNTAASNRILLKVEDYSPERGIYKPRKSVSTEHFPSFNDSAILECSRAQVKEFKSPECMNISRNMHPSETLFTSNICRKPFSVEASLNEHMLIHSKDRRHNCERCGNVFERKDDVQAHICIHTRNKGYNCNYCEKKFKSNYYLQLHIRTHTGEKPYESNDCEKTFTQKCSKQKHIRTYKVEKLYKCEYCEKTFTRKGHKEVHIRIHTGEKPYECEYCEKTFAKKGNKNLHVRTHTGEKPYKCEYCKRTFTQKGHKDAHIRTHTGVKPYKCEYCENIFTRKYSKQRHIRKHTGEKPYKCRICGRSFAQQHHLKLHKCIQIDG